MGGGSYNYLCYKDTTDIFSVESELEQMRDRLAGLGYAADAASETEELLLILRQIQVRLFVRLDRLRLIWREVEWWDSGDVGEDAVKAALAKYRESGAPQKGLDIARMFLVQLL